MGRARGMAGEKRKEVALAGGRGNWPGSYIYVRTRGLMVYIAVQRDGGGERGEDKF